MHDHLPRLLLRQRAQPPPVSRRPGETFPCTVRRYCRPEPPPENRAGHSDKFHPQNRVIDFFRNLDLFHM